MSDFALLPPEINSARISAGPGASPLLAAASSWDALSHGLTETATACTSTVGALETVWMGPSALAMSHASRRYTAWLTHTALAAERTATQARAAAAAYETALASSVPLPVIATNRAQLAALVNTNVLGQNTAAIMALEAQYAEMWAQDVAAMYAYQAASAQVTVLPQLPSPPVIVQNALADLADPTTVLGQLNTYTQSFLSSGPWQAPTEVLALLTNLWVAGSIASATSPIFGAKAAPVVPAPVVAVTPATTPAAVVARTGIASRLGPMAVPPSWARPQTAPVFPQGVPLAVAEDSVATPMPTPMPLMGATGDRRQRAEPQYGQRVQFMTRPPSGG